MKKIFPALTLLLILFTVGCQQIIEIDLPDQTPELVVNCIFTPDSVWQARVTASQGIQVGTEPKAVTNAFVLVLENGAAVDTLRHDSADIYLGSSGSMPIAGHTYTIQASATGYTSVTGTDYVPVPVVPTSMTWRDSVSVDQFGGYLGEFAFHIDDPAGVSNFYVLTVYSVDTFVDQTDTFVYIFPITVQIQDPILEYDAYSGSVRFEDATFDGTNRTIKVLINSYDHEQSSLLFFSLSTTTEHYYRYGQTMSDYLETSFNPFAEPVRIHSNMTPGMGIFAGYASSLGLVP